MPRKPSQAESRSSQSKPRKQSDSYNKHKVHHGHDAKNKHTQHHNDVHVNMHTLDTLGPTNTVVHMPPHSDGDHDVDNRFTQREREWIEHVLKCCDVEDGFDIYQLEAFRSNNAKTCKKKVKYCSDAIKALLCALTQIFGIIIISVDLVLAGLEEKGICNPLDRYYDEQGRFLFYHFMLKALAFLFSSFLAYYSIEALDNIDKGMYFHMHHAENLQWINQVWLRIGFSINLTVAIIAVYGSYLVIYFSTNSLDMVLNSVALFFVADLDDLLVRRKDYEKIGDFLRYQLEHGSNINLQKGCRVCCRRGCNKFVSCIGWLYTAPFRVFKKVTVLICIVLPFVVAYCY